MNLSVQSHRLLSKPVPKKFVNAKDLLERQVAREVNEIAQELGPAIRDKHVTVVRRSAYLRMTFIWRRGCPGLLLKKEKKPEAFPFLVRPGCERITRSAVYVFATEHFVL